MTTPPQSAAYPSVEWCGAGLYTPVYGDGEYAGKVVAEQRRMCGEKGPHEWHQDRFDGTVRWKALPPLAERQTAPSAPDGPSS